VRAGGRAAQSCERACVWREARVAKLYQDLYRQVVLAFKAPKAPSASAKSVQAYYLQVQPSEHILGLFRPLRPSSCTRWVAVGLNVLHTALPLTCQLGVCTSCSRALDWVCLPARRSGSPSHAPVAARPLCVWLTLDGGTNTQCSPNAHPMLTHSLARSLFGQPRHGWNSMLQKLSLAAPERKGALAGLSSSYHGWQRLGQLEGGGGLSAPHAHLGPRGALIHAGLPCESARLVMQGWTFAGDAARRKSNSGEGRHPFTGLPATGEQLGCYSSRGAILVVSHRGCEGVGRVKRDKRHLTVRDCRCSCAQKSVWGRLWRGSPV